MSRAYLIVSLSLFASSVAIFLSAQQLGLHLEPYWIPIPALCIPVVGVVMRKYPAALIPALIFVGAFKVAPAASNLDFWDPTFWVLILLLATMLLHGLLALVGWEEPTLGLRIRSQFAGIIGYLVFVAVVAFSYLYSQAPEYGFRAMTHFAVIGSVIFFSSLFLVRSESDIRQLVTSTLLLSMAIAMQEYITRQPETVTDPTRLDAGFLTGLGLLLLLLPPKSMRAALPRPVLLLAIPCLAAGLAISIARGPALSCIVTIALSCLMSKRRTGLLSRKALAVTIGLFVIPVVIASFHWLEKTAPRKFGKKEWELSNIVELSDPGGTAGQRLELYRVAIRGFAEKPVLGWGVGSYSVYASGADMRLYPHNLILLVAMEQGLIGLAALAAFGITLAWTLKKIIAATGGEWIFLLWIILYGLGTSMFSGSLDDQRGGILWVGVAFACWRMLKLRYRQIPYLDEFAGAVAPASPRYASALWRNQNPAVLPLARRHA